MLTRRSLLRGLIAAPAVVSVGSIMPVRLWKPEPAWDGLRLVFDPLDTPFMQYMRRNYTQFVRAGYGWPQLPPKVALGGWLPPRR
jgi:hypothetical protein